MNPCSAMSLVSAMPGAFFSDFSAWATASFLVAQPEPKAITPASAAARMFSWCGVFMVALFGCVCQLFAGFGFGNHQVELLLELHRVKAAGRPDDHDLRARRPFIPFVL